MPEFFLELFSEEIPARMQFRAGVELNEICGKALQSLSFSTTNFRVGPRRISVTGDVNKSFGNDGGEEIRGPREGASDAALNGFARKAGVSRAELFARDGFYFARTDSVQRSASEIIQSELKIALTKLPWPKSMRWGSSGDFVWVRPLRRIVCLLDGDVVPITLGPVTASNETEGHRLLAPGGFAVTSAADWKEKLREHKVVGDHAERRDTIQKGLAAKAGEKNVTIVEDAGLLEEVNGLVEWPVPLLGRIDTQFMDLPPEVRELSMKVNQKYFATRDASGKPAPYFAFVANLEASDGGAAIIAGNERVLRARLADARHFWEVDLRTPLNELLPKLVTITFHAKIGNQRERAERIAKLSREICNMLDKNDAMADQAEWAGRLCKADLVTGMVGEFPELQGIMGGYYAEINPREWAGNIVGRAIKTHYQPKGLNDAVPSVGEKVSESVALADKMDTLREFFRIGEKPTGSGDPYALRRAALGVIRIILENDLRLPLKPLLKNDELFGFIIERLRVKLRGEGQRYDVLDAVLAAGEDDDLVRIMQRVNAVSAFLLSEDGANLLTAYRRAANILRIEDAKDGPHTSEPVRDPLTQREEEDLRDMLAEIQWNTVEEFRTGQFAVAMAKLSKLRQVVDAFFDKVTVNATEPELRRNRLRLLARLRDLMHQIADFSKIEG